MTSTTTTSANTKSKHSHDEQLRCCAGADSSLSRSEAMPVTQPKPRKRERLAALLAGDLNFYGENSRYASHVFHAFAAKFPPQLPCAFIRDLTASGATVLDPMMGSGTTIVEALLAGRLGVGLDIDPLALRLSRVKTRPLETEVLRQIGHKVIARAQALVSKRTFERECTQQFDAPTQAFIDYWFFPATQRRTSGISSGDADGERRVSTSLS